MGSALGLCLYVESLCALGQVETATALRLPSPSVKRVRRSRTDPKLRCDPPKCVTSYITLSA